MWFVFRLRRKTNHVSSLLRERSERKRYQNHSVFVKTHPLPVRAKRARDK
ncbi:MAG: hypothetical protein U5L45_14840 [Saprospiraceae bacterium]|nr:hypothetical protein [Saprospiraceae bacterium]